MDSSAHRDRREILGGLAMTAAAFGTAAQAAAAAPVIEWNMHMFSSNTAKFPFSPRGTYKPDVSRLSPDPLTAYQAHLKAFGIDRAMFVHPEQVEEIRRRHPAVQKARLVVDGAMGSDSMVLHCEADAAPEGLEAALVESIREVTKLRGEVRLLAVGNLPNDGKVIEDLRKFE